MTDEPEAVDGQVVDEGPAPELAPAVDEPLLKTAAELAVIDPHDKHEVMLRMDDHDVQLLLQQVQSSALRKWVYSLPNGTTGLTVHAVQDITQRMNWTGKCSIGVLPETLHVERITEDAGNGPEPFWVATIFAKDESTGAVLPGSAMEPVRMRLRASTAAAKRKDGMSIPEDNTVFDPFSRTKAIQKATRNAIGAFIPEEIEQTVLAMFAKDPSRVERIQTEQEQRVAEMPPPLDDDEARALIAEAEAIYDEIRELGAGQGKVKMPPGQFAAYKLQAQHSHDRLRDLVEYVKQRRDAIPGELEREAEQRESVETAAQVPCPKCGQGARQFCKGIRGSHPERVQARLEQIRAAKAGAS